LTPEGLAFFHSLRAIFTTLLHGSFARAKEQMSIARDSCPGLTMSRYTKTIDGRFSNFIEQIVTLFPRKIQLRNT